MVLNSASGVFPTALVNAPFTASGPWSGRDFLNVPAKHAVLTIDDTGIADESAGDAFPPLFRDLRTEPRQFNAGAFRVDFSAPSETAPLSNSPVLKKALADSLLRDARAGNGGAVTATDYRRILKNPELATKEYAVSLIRELKIQKALVGDPDLYYLKREIHSVLKRAWTSERAFEHAAIDARKIPGELTRKEIRAHKALADERLRREYEPLIASFKDPDVSAFTLVSLSTFVPYLFLEPVARFAGAHLSQWLSFLPGVYAPGTPLAGGAAALMPAWDFPFDEPYLLGAFFLGNVVTALSISGLRDTFKFSLPIMSALDFADRAGGGGILSRASRSVKTFLAKPKPKGAKTAEVILNHGLVGYEDELLEDTAPAPGWILKTRGALTSSNFKFIKSVGEALPATRGQWKLYKTDVALVNTPIVALFSGLLPVAAEFAHHFADPAYAPIYQPIDILTRSAMAIGAGLLAWSIGSIGNTRIMNSHKNYSSRESAANLATRDRQVYGIAALAPIMMFLIPNFHLAWQQGAQIGAATSLLVGTAILYSTLEAGWKKNAEHAETTA